MLWIVALALFAVWLLGLIFGRGGFIHILLLCSVAIALVQWVADYRAAQRD